MESAVVGLLVAKIAGIIENEASLIGGVRDELDELKLELRSMHSFIQDAQTMYHLNAVDRDWVASVVDMCHPVETIIDNFMHHMNKQVNKTNFIYKIFYVPKNLLVRRRVAKKIQEINRKLKSIPERRQRYQIQGYLISQDDQMSLGYSNTGKVSLHAGQSLLNHEQLTVGANSLRMQTDGNLVLREHSDIIWSSGTAGKGNKCYVIMQSDGNLVIYDEHRAVWASNTVYGDDKYEFILQEDRNMVIYKGSERTAIWASNTRKFGV